jgi:hypothetical protein
VHRFWAAAVNAGPAAAAPAESASEGAGTAPREAPRLGIGRAGDVTMRRLVG